MLTAFVINDQRKPINRLLRRRGLKDMWPEQTRKTPNQQMEKEDLMALSGVMIDNYCSSHTLLFPVQCSERKRGQERGGGGIFIQVPSPAPSSPTMQMLIRYSSKIVLK